MKDLGTKEELDNLKAAFNALEKKEGILGASGCTGPNVSFPTTLALVKSLACKCPVVGLFSAEEIGYKHEFQMFVADLCGMADHCCFKQVQDLKDSQAEFATHGGECDVPFVSSPMGNDRSSSKKASPANYLVRCLIATKTYQNGHGTG